MRSPSHLKDVAARLAPPLICITMYGVFQLLAHLLGPLSGYLAGFLFYWVVWCALFPLWILGGKAVGQLFHRPLRQTRRAIWIDLALLTLPLLLGYGYAFPRAIPGVSPGAVAVSAFLSIINGTLEELLWRGVYIARFRRSFVWGYLYPAIGFALWHLAPLSVFPNRAPGGAVSFVGFAAFAGLLWGWVARRNQSIAFTTVSHVLLDFSGLGGRLYFP